MISGEGGSKKEITLNQTHTPGDWFDVAVTWDASAVNGEAPSTISTSINGTPITSDGGEISGEFFDSKTLANWIIRKGPGVIQFKLPSNADGSLYIDDIVLYSDVAGTSTIYSEDFEDLGEGTAFTSDMLDAGKTKEVIVGPRLKP